MANLAVINMPVYSLQVVVNRAVGNAWIIWVDLEPKVLDRLADVFCNIVDLLPWFRTWHYGI